MSKAIRRYSEADRKMVIERRIKGETKGLGYWATIDARKHLVNKNGNNAQSTK